VDASNIEAVTKEELLSFYDEYIHPSSPHRSVLSVHVKSQIETPAPDPNEQLAEMVRLFIATEGYDVPPEEVTEAVKGDPSLIPQNISALIVARGYDNDRVAQSMAKGAEMLSAQLEGREVTANGVADRVLKEVKVDDLQKFRDTLKVDDKPNPVQPLETFYECESPRL
jgi:insulysin